MRVLVDGPLWGGMWAEIVVNELSKNGYDIDIIYHNKKHAKARIISKINKLFPVTRNHINWEDSQHEYIEKVLLSGDYDVYFSIQGKADSASLARIKKRGIKTLYWLGDVFVESTRRRLDLLREASLSGSLDVLLVSYRGTADYLADNGFLNYHYLPFGYSREYHRLEPVSQLERKKFSAGVSFVGTCYPERVEIIRYLNQHLDEPVKVWGRSWSGSGIKSGGRLSLQQSLKVYACSDICLNIHHHLTDNGFNMKFYEIPAAGGFQICDWQEELQRSPLGMTPSYRSKEELLEKIRFYQNNPAARSEIAHKTNSVVSEQCNYESSLAGVLKQFVNERRV